MWLVYALLTFFAWGAADLFYKKSNEESEKYSHLKTSIFVGLVMGAHAIALMLIRGIDYDPRNLLIYLPVSLMYILSMTVGYFGLKYLELSVSSPIQNASGAVTCVMLCIALREMPDKYSMIAIVLITAGVILLGVFEKKKENEFERREHKKYKIGFVAFMMPIIYCFIDSLGTFFDGRFLDDFTTTPLVGVTEETLEDVANISYELTFLAVAIVLFAYVRLIRKEKVFTKRSGVRTAAAALETAGQFSYVYALSGNGIVAAPVIASYCVCSAVLARIFLKEKLSAKQYFAIALVVAGIAILGVLEEVG